MFPILAQESLVDLEAQAGPCEGLQHGVLVGQDWLNDPLEVAWDPGMRLEGIFLRQFVLPVSEDEVPVDLVTDPVGPGVRR